MDIKPVDVFLSSNYDATNASSLDYPHYTFLPSIENCVGVSLLNATIPFSYNVVDYFNNEILFTFGAGAPAGLTSKTFLVQLEPGTYDSTTLVTAFEAALVSNTKVAGSSDSNLSTTAGMTCFVNLNTNQVTFYPTLVPSTSFTISFTSRGLHKVLGFNQFAFVNSTTDAPTSGTTFVSETTSFYDASYNLITSTNHVESPKAVQLSGPNDMFIHSDLSANFHGDVRNYTTSGDLFAMFLINPNYGGIIDKEIAFPVRIPFTARNISKASFYLTIGDRTAYSSPTSTQSNITEQSFISLNGEAFNLAIRFYCLSSTSMSPVMNTYGDKYMTSVSNNEGGKRPHEYGIQKTNVLRLKR